MVAGELSQSAAFRQCHWNFSTGVGFPGHPIPRAGGNAKQDTLFSRHCPAESDPLVELRRWQRSKIPLTPKRSRSHKRNLLRVPVVTEEKPQRMATAESFRATVPGFIFSGVLLGLLPMWNSAVFIAAAAVLGLLFILFPLRLQMLALAITAGLIALPQMFYLGTGSGRAQMPRLLHWGYMVDQPTAENVLKYLGFTFGFKWLLIALALIFAGSLQRRFFLAALSLVAVAFSFQFTIEVLANQKFLHIWVIIANLFVAFALWRLWRFSLGGSTVPGKLAASVLFLLVIPGGIIDFFPIHNTGWGEVTYKNDPLIDWLKKNTKPRDIFLTDRFVNHPILMAGRRILYGWPYYAWSAGYNAGKYDRLYTAAVRGQGPLESVSSFERERHQLCGLRQCRSEG